MVKSTGSSFLSKASQVMGITSSTSIQRVRMSFMIFVLVSFHFVAWQFFCSVLAFSD